MGKNTWIRQPSSILICVLSTICILLLFVIIILVMAVTKHGGDQKEQDFVKIQNVSTTIRSDMEQLIIQVGSLERDTRRVLSAVGRLADVIQNRNETANSQEKDCGSDWIHYGHSCYYVSNISRSWPNAKKDCEEKDAHLVVINSKEEQEEMNIFSRGRATWIGLTDDGGEWRWVDGSPYTSSMTFWGEGQPDEWTGHGLGGGEDCAQIKSSKSWNDDHCSRSQKYICEKAFA